MSFTILWSLCFVMAAASASCSECCGCSCRNYKFFQFRRPNLIPVFESQSPCESIYNDQEHVYDTPLETIYSAETLQKLEPSVNRYFTPIVESRPLPCHKCICSKPSSSQRLMGNVPRYYKRRYCNEQMVEAIGIRPSSNSYRNPCCSQYDEYGGCNQCNQCSQCDQCGQYGTCNCTPLVFRPSAPVLPMTLPASCIC